MMKNRLFAGLGLAFSCLLVQAHPITRSQAQALAAAFLKTGGQPSFVKRKSVVPESETQPLYVFSRGVGKGFVIVSGDDALPAIIGYTDSGDFDEEHLPPALQGMLSYYTEAAEALQRADSADSSARRAPRKASGTRDISPLMSSHWHQSWPYNNQAPYLKGTTTRAATGCVATAASQILYYWRKDLDSRTKYGTPTYGYGDAPVTESIPSGTPLKWDLMQDTYSSDAPEEGTSAVATLMACVGASGWLTYGSSTSGQISDQVNVFANQFGLNGGSTVWKGNYSQTTWEKMIIQDLEAGRPILYSGVHTTNGGHAVVVDGYQASTNLFHFNFGWGAGNGYDGYYTVDDVTGMNGFSGSQGMVWNIHPKRAKLSGTLSLPTGQFVSRVRNEVTASITNGGTLPARGFYLYCLTGTNTPSSASAAQASETSTLLPSGSTATITFSFTPSGTSTYTLYLCDSNKNILAKLTEVSTLASVPALTLNSLRADEGGTSEMLELDGVRHRVAHIYNTRKANLTARFTNGPEGTLCTPSVQGLLSAYESGGFGTPVTKTKKNVTFTPGATGEMVFDFANLTDGTLYKFALAGTASTNRSFPITYATPDTVVYFRLKGANLTATPNGDGTEVTLTGNYNPTVFATLAADSTVCRYDLTGVAGPSLPLVAANRNALFYVDAAQQVAGRNIVSDGVCQTLDLVPGHNFLPREDFVALEATYHAT